MGMCTEFHYHGLLNHKAVSEGVVDILRYMVRIDEITLESLQLPKHELFDSERWYYMLRGGSSYFDSPPMSALYKDENHVGCTHGSEYVLFVHCNFKNYDGEIRSFVDWIEPYMEAHVGQFMGYGLYEECVKPSLIYYKVKETGCQECKPDVCIGY